MAAEAAAKIVAARAMETGGSKYLDRASDRQVSWTANLVIDRMIRLRQRVFSILHEAPSCDHLVAFLKEKARVVSKDSKRLNEIAQAFFNEQKRLKIELSPEDFIRCQQIIDSASFARRADGAEEGTLTIALEMMGDADGDDSGEEIQDLEESLFSQWQSIRRLLVKEEGADLRIDALDRLYKRSDDAGLKPALDKALRDKASSREERTQIEESFYSDLARYQASVSMEQYLSLLSKMGYTQTPRVNC
jgi:hypothetical protein